MASIETAETTSNGQYADVNGVHMYYEIHGTGRPLVLLHGGLGSGEMFGSAVGTLTDAGHQVILPDLQGHGRTADIDRPMDVRLMGDDIAALIKQLGHEKVDLVGYSLGGGVALQTAARHPELVRRLVVSSANVWRTAVFPELLAQQSQVNAGAIEFLRNTPMYQTYQRVAPRPQDFGRLLDKIGASMAKDYDYSEDVRGLQVPTLIVAGDSEMAPPSHYVEAFGLLDGGKRDGGWMGEGLPKGGHALAILPRLTHYNIINSPLFATTVLAFLDAG